jgi:hypothetical protein
MSTSEIKSLNDSIVGMQGMLDNAKLEITSFDSGNKSAAARARKSLQNIKSASHTMRKDIMSKAKTIPVKPRAKKKTVDVVKETETTVDPVDETPALTDGISVLKVKKPRKKKA